MPTLVVIFLGAIWNTLVNKDWEFHLANATSTVAAVWEDRLLLWLPVLLVVVKLYREFRLIADDNRSRRLKFGNNYSLKLEDVMRIKFKRGNGTKAGTGGSGGEDDDTDPKPGTKKPKSKQ